MQKVYKPNVYEITFLQERKMIYSETIYMDE